MLKTDSFAKSLLSWYDKQGRKDLPWRKKITPYRIWISEIMLQQTQVKTVIPYFERFLARFPTVNDLAKAHEDEVLHLWTGLGYYARARNLHQSAKQIVTQYGSQFPDTFEQLQSLPGIGRSTANAILAIAYEKKAAILDGNVKRVLTRLHAIFGVPTQTKITQQLWKIAEKQTPQKRTADYTQAIMDLGATICTRTKPLCRICPVAKICQAHLQNKQEEFPTPKPRKKIPVRAVNLLIFHDKKRNQVLLEKRPPVGIWGGLWSFPECSIETDVKRWCEDILNLNVLTMKSLPVFKHVFTHFQLNITPIYVDKYEYKNRVRDSAQYIWYTLDKPSARGLAAPVKRLLQSLSSQMQ